MRRRVLVQGVTRLVVLAAGHAWKFPHPLNGWRLFLQGLLANTHERLWWKWAGGDPRLCPVVWADPLGLLVVMPLCRTGLTAKDISTYESLEGLPRHDYKTENFGRLHDGRVVLLDYGS